ncbi:DUF1751 domain-containing protein [Candidatus Acetothermia bacterium]|nr:DUF1751 domain-containing protein [Candidatus Acetothermia bacterium]MBI3643683.1 DUF1751 domain-containing protein [Candidatus Acetothermia bacterium]
MDDLIFRLRRFREFLWHNSEPVTRTLICIELFFFLVNFLFFLGSSSIAGFFKFDTTDAISRPWTFLTYPLVTTDPIGLIFSGYWLWIVGSTLERSWTSRVYLRFLIIATLVTSISLWIGSLLLGAIGASFIQNTDVGLEGLWILLAALTVAWALLNPEQVVLLGFLLPIQGRYIMWITIALSYFLFAFSFRAPWLGFFALAGIGYAYQFTRNRIYKPFSYSKRPHRMGDTPPIERIMNRVDSFLRKFRR